jgi:hypothetical protein
VAGMLLSRFDVVILLLGMKFLNHSVGLAVLYFCIILGKIIGLNVCFFHYSFSLTHDTLVN